MSILVVALGRFLFNFIVMLTCLFGCLNRLNRMMLFLMLLNFFCWNIMVCSYRVRFRMNWMLMCVRESLFWRFNFFMLLDDLINDIWVIFLMIMVLLNMLNWDLVRLRMNWMFFVVWESFFWGLHIFMLLHHKINLISMLYLMVMGFLNMLNWGVVYSDGVNFRLCMV